MSELLRDGYSVIPQAIDAELRLALLDSIRPLCHAAMKETADTLPFDLTQPLNLKLIRRAASLLHSDGVRYLAAAIIPKYPGEGMRPWHVDWWDWDSMGLDARPAQVGIIFYLDDATKESGALSVLIRSHQTSRYRGLWGTKKTRLDQITLEVPAGAAIVIDSRLLHSVTPNTSTHLRIAVTLWFLIGWETLPEQVQASAMLCMSPAFKPLLGELYPDYQGSVKPRAHDKRPSYEKARPIPV